MKKLTEETAKPILTRVSAGSACLLDSKHWFHNFRVQFPRSSPKLAQIGISQPNPRRRKIAVYRLSMKIFASNFTDRLTTELKTLLKNAKLGKMGRDRLRDLLVEFWDPLPVSTYISETVEARSCTFGKQIDHKEYYPKCTIRSKVTLTKAGHMT